MPVSVAAQELGSSSKKRKRESSKDTFDAAQFVRGTATTTIPSSQKDLKGKGKAREALLGEDGVTGTRAELALTSTKLASNTDEIATVIDQANTSPSTANL